MAKTRTRRSTQERETNWLIIGGLIGIGILAFGGLLFLALRTPEPEAVLPLSEFCAQNPDNCAVQGDSNAPVTLVEVSDFGCPHCTDFHNNTAESLEANFVEPGTVEWFALPYALRPETVPAAAAALCAGEQDQYFEYTNTMYAIEDTAVRLSSEGIRQSAETLGLDMEAFVDCLDSRRHNDTVTQNREAAALVQVSGTPTFFLNDVTISGAQPFSVFEQTINSILSQ